jgi:hypothetical protein
MNRIFLRLACVMRVKQWRYLRVTFAKLLLAASLILLGVAAILFGFELITTGKSDQSLMVLLAALFNGVLAGSVLQILIFGQTKATPGLRSLSRVSDLIPTPKLRKRIKKLIADQADHLQKLKNAKRLGSARWIVFCTWLLVAWYVFSAPVSAVINAIAGYSKRAGG